MKKFLLVLSLFTAAQGLQAQTPGGPPAGVKMQAAPSIGRIYGKLVDSAGKGIRDASIVVLQSRLDSATRKMKDVLLKGVTTQSNGDFNIEDLPIRGALKVKASATGYQALDQTVSFQPQRPAGGAPTTGAPAAGAMPSFEKDLGKLTLKNDVQQLAGVVVTASSTRMRMDIDKKVFNVDQNIVSAGGTAVDVMKNVPSVNVDIDGNVTLRNASPQLYIDGRPTTLTLDQIPADAIESVEVITNPSAKYDASGGNAGILNIILKKNKKTGYNGNITAGVDKRGGVNGGGSFSLRQNKFNFTVNSFANQMRNRSTGSTDIRNLLTNPNMLVAQDSRTRNNGGFIFGRVGVDYFATNRTTISLGAVRVHGSFKPTDYLNTDSSYENGPYISYSERNARNEREFNAYGFQGGMKYLFPKQGQELTADVNYFSGTNESNALYLTDIFAGKGGAQTGNIRQQILGNGTNSFLTLQTDYVTPLKGSAKLEAGARAQLRTQENSQGNYFYNAATGQFEPKASASSNYSNTDNVYAAYLSFGNTIKNFGYKVGLRAESSDYQGELTDTKQTFTNKYPISLFPSIFLSQKLQDQQEVQLSYTRRINRPFFMQVIPFIDSTDQLNWSQGNAGLKPEFTNSLEASYAKTLKPGNTLLASVYYKYSTNLITRYLDTLTDASGDKRPLSTYINANSSRSVGAELTSQNTLTKWWDMNANVNVYNSKINTDNIAGASQDPMWSWFAKMNNNFKLPRNFKAQLSGTYQSRTNLPVNQNSGGQGGGGPFGGGAQSAAQGYIKSNYGVDAALSKSFLKNNAATVTFNVSDIFGTRRFDQYSQSAFFIQDRHRLNDVPMFRLNFSFRFGQMDMSLFKRKNTKGEAEGTQGAMQGMQ
ncbi:outer membrane beta-barrel protein [Paraflavisolibacter sp. H34]|uniref:outer membrane beta-barrel protein n=1 Tax=Huijunlia imazamoxiresistens TaxID=3127457 RepID=UPI0030178EE2